MTALHSWSAPCLALLALGCSSTAPDAVAPKPIALVSIDPATPAATTSERDWPPKRIRLGQTACLIRGEVRAGLRNLELRAEPGGHVFARVDPRESTSNELALPPGEPGEAVLTVGNERAFVAGFVGARDVPVRMREPEMLGGFIVPKYGAELQWTRAEAGTLHLRYRLLEGFAGGMQLALEVSCKSVTLDRGYFDAMEVLPARPMMQKARLKPGHVALYRDRFGATKLDLLIRNSPGVWVLEEAPDRVRIAWERQNEVLVGWVLLATLDRGAPAPRARHSSSHRVVPEAVRAQVDGIRCKRSLALVAGDGEELVTVGSVRAGVPLATGRTLRELTEIRIDELPVKLSAGERLWARTSDVDACRPPSEPAKP